MTIMKELYAINDGDLPASMFVFGGVKKREENTFVSKGRRKLVKMYADEEWLGLLLVSDSCRPAETALFEGIK